MDQLQVRIPRIDEEPTSKGVKAEEKEDSMEIELSGPESKAPQDKKGGASSPASAKSASVRKVKKSLKASTPGSSNRPAQPLRANCVFLQHYFNEKRANGEDLKSQTKIRETFSQACQQWNQLPAEEKNKFVEASRKNWDAYYQALEEWKKAKSQVKRPPNPYALFLSDLWKTEWTLRKKGQKPRSFVEMSRRASKIWGLQKPYKRRYEEERKEYVEKLRKLSEEVLQKSTTAVAPQKEDAASSHEEEYDSAESSEEESDYDEEYDSLDSDSEWDEDEESFATASDSESDEDLDEDDEEEESDKPHATASNSKTDLARQSSTDELYVNSSSQVGPSKESVEDIDYKEEVISSPGMSSYNESLSSLSTDSVGSEVGSDVMEVPSSVMNQLESEMASQDEGMDQNDSGDDDSEIDLSPLKAQEEEDENPQAEE